MFNMIFQYKQNKSIGTSEDFPTNSNKPILPISPVTLKGFPTNRNNYRVCVCVCVCVHICDSKRKSQAVKRDGHPVPLRAFLGSYPKVGNGGNMGPTKRVEMEIHRLKKVPAGKQDMLVSWRVNGLREAHP